MSENKTKPCTNCGQNPNEDRTFSWRDGPFVTYESGWDREWVHGRGLRFYLYQIEKGEAAGKWIVVDRDTDLRHGKAYVRKSACVNAFVRKYKGYDQVEAR